MKKYIMIFLGLIGIQISFASKINEINSLATITVNSGEYERFDTPVSISLDAITSIYEDNLILYEIIESTPIPVEFQISAGETRYINWILTGITKPGKTRKFLLSEEKRANFAKSMRIETKHSNYILFSNNKPVLQYNSGVVFPPAGTDQVFQRSGFIHPLFSPNNIVLTSIQPLDHLHHYGLFNPWTKTNFRGEEVDFWNLSKRQGRVSFGGLTSLNEGPVFTSLQALQEHIAWPDSPNETIAMNELQEMKVYKRSDDKFLIELKIILNPVEDIKIEEYRYGGVTIRATPEWTKETSDFITSRGLNRDQAEGERAEWCLVWGESSEGKAGILMMGHSANFNHPEPLRVWPSDGNKGRGDVFINFNPAKNVDWLLKTGNSYLLRYRLIVFEGKLNENEANLLWNDFSNPPVITWEK